MDAFIYVIFTAMFLMLGIIILLLVLHHIERKDLYTRLMSRDLTDYKRASGRDDCGYTPSAHQAVLSRWRRKQVTKDGDR